MHFIGEKIKCFFIAPFAQGSDGVPACIQIAENCGVAEVMFGFGDDQVINFRCDGVPRYTDLSAQ